METKLARSRQRACMARSGSRNAVPATATNQVRPLRSMAPLRATAAVRPGRPSASASSEGTGDQQNAFKISSLRGVARTAPYFHDNSAKTLEEVVKHYARFFELVHGYLDHAPAPQAEAASASAASVPAQ